MTLNTRLNPHYLNQQHLVAINASTEVKSFVMFRADVREGPKSLLVRCMVNVSSRNWLMKRQSRLNVARNARIGCRLVKVLHNLVS